MKQLIHNLKNGEFNIIEVPIPSTNKGEVLISTKVSLISKGTEKMLVDFGKANLYKKAKLQPEKFKEVLTKLKADGLIDTFEAVNSKLSEPIPMGYSNVGIVINVGDEVENIKVGDRVVSNGSHSEIVSVPQNLCAKIPDNVCDETAAFTVIGSIALQGIRLAKPSFGETVVVIGLGLVGLMTIQLLKANGCKVLGLDTDRNKVHLARKFGIISNQIVDNVDPFDWCIDQNKGNEIDISIITAATKSSEPIDLAARLCRKRGKIILVGVSGMELKRELFYKKELSFQVSCSYGPGRYDSIYENSNEYPIGFVRWTAKRNFEAILNAFSNDQISIENLVSDKLAFEDVGDSFSKLISRSSTLGLILNYQNKKNITQKVLIKNNNKKDFLLKQSDLNVSFIGAGNYAKRKLIPTFKKYGANLIGIAANNGLKPSTLGKKFNFKYATTNTKEIFKDDENKIIVIASRHDSHSEFISQALNSKKHVFVEKPLCLNMDQLEKIKQAYTGEQILMVGFNRRFSPFTINLKNYLNKNNSQKAFSFTCNAGYLDNNHWLNNKKVGGGRLIGEACHFVDLLRFLSGSNISSIDIKYLQDTNKIFDTFTINMSFSDGSIGSIDYYSNGCKDFPKERLEVFVNGGIIRIDDFRKITSWGINGFKNDSSYFQDKGQNNCVKSFLNSVSKGIPSPINIDELFEVQEKLLGLI